MKMRELMTVKRQSLVRLAFIVCLGAVWGCSHKVSSGGPSLPPVSQTPGPPPLPEPVPAQPAPSPPPPVTVLPEDTSSDCLLVPGQGEPIAAVALPERVDPTHAPNPTNESERLLFRQLYETLVRVDCEGRVRPGLAQSWRFDAGRNVWTVILREGARFSDGTPVISADVVSSWTAGSSGELRPQALGLVRSIVPIDDQTMEIALRNPHEDSPLALAHTDLAVARRPPGSRWPLGTRSARMAPDDGTPARTGPSVLTLNLPGDPLSAVGANASSIRFLVAPSRDLRDLLDEGVDLLVTRDRTALNYAATLPQFFVAPLEWLQTHVLLTPGRTGDAGSPSPEALEALARDAVRGEARGAKGPFWWQSLPDCDIAPSQPQAPSTNGRIVYDASDNTARDLAERLVGLARAAGPDAAAADAAAIDAAAILGALLPNGSSRPYQRAAGLTGEPLVSAMRAGNDAGYIIALDRHPLDPCRDLRLVLENARWLNPAAIVPLVDTRLQAIVRRGHSGLVTEGDGELLLGVGDK